MEPTHNNLLDFVRLWARANFPRRTPLRITIEWDQGKPEELSIPERLPEPVKPPLRARRSAEEEEEPAETTPQMRVRLIRQMIADEGLRLTSGQIVANLDGQPGCSRRSVENTLAQMLEDEILDLEPATVNDGLGKGYGLRAWRKNSATGGR